MSSHQSRRTSGAALRARVPLVSIAIAVLAGGCAANTGPSKVSGPVGYPGDPAPRVAAADTTKVELEADGLPVQLAPKHRRAMPDDPTQPWSPNYGSGRAEAPDAAPEPAAAKLAALPSPSVTRVATRALSPPSPPLAADDVIRMAVAQHEMRQN
jgi:hypothetical protein